MNRQSKQMKFFIREGGPSQGQRNYPNWLQFMMIADQKVIVVDMEAAPLGGWNYGRVTEQGADDWPGMSIDAILAFKVGDHNMKPAAQETADSFAKWLEEKGLL